MTSIRFILSLFLISILTACGGGGSSNPAPTPVVQPTTAILKLSTFGTLATGTALAGIGISVILPAGVTVKTGTDGAVSTGVVSVSGVAMPGSTTTPLYTPRTGAVPGKVAFVMVNNAVAGFGVGEFATVNCDIAAGSYPKATDFTLADFKPIDLNGASVSGLSAGVAATIN